MNTVEGVNHRSVVVDQKILQMIKRMIRRSINQQMLDHAYHLFLEEDPENQAKAHGATEVRKESRALCLQGELMTMNSMCHRSMKSMNKRRLHLGPNLQPRLLLSELRRQKIP